MDRRYFIVGAIALAATPQLADAQGAGWTLLGSRTINWTSNRESIIVRAAGPISGLSFRTRGGELLVTEVELVFARGRGAPQRIPTNMRVQPNRRSNTIWVRGARDIRRVDFRYRRVNTRGGTRPTTVELFGRR